MLGKYGETLVVDWGPAKAAVKDDRFADEAALVSVQAESGSSANSFENTVMVGDVRPGTPDLRVGHVRLRQIHELRDEANQSPHRSTRSRLAKP